MRDMTVARQSYPRVRFNAKADTACFSDVLFRAGGDHISYKVPTYSALVGLTKSIYWKPTFEWVIDRVRVLNPIATHTVGTLNPKMCEALSDGKSDRAITTYLTEVSYNIEAHFEWRDLPEYAGDRNCAKHLRCFEQALQAGGRMTPFLGRREANCYCDVSAVDDIMDGEGAYDNASSYELNMMLHSIIYDDLQKPTLRVGLWQPVMNNGIIEFIRPEDVPHIREIENYAFDIKSMDISEEELAHLKKVQAGEVSLHKASEVR